MRQKISTFWAVYRTYGSTEIFRLIWRKIFSRPSFLEFDDKIDWISADNFLQKLQIADEHSLNSIITKDINREGFFDSIYDLGPELSKVLVGLISSRKPTLIIETGVAAGKSTNVILKALGSNGKGKLISVDVTSNVGELVEEDYRKQWTLNVLPNFGRKRAFRRILTNNPQADIFLHDSDHSSNWQKFEVIEALRHLPNVSFLLIDDIQPDVSNFLMSKYGYGNCTFFDESGEKKSAAVKIAIKD